ncbi:MAG: Asp-tRNA(Asn)/Glu-tRNA(Gln) amidotransferase subunit GatC [Phycisphaerales bacterium]|jgi:aspartyl-tRNA(Asn)/glutamyl-tRNA(Gln) amidotransferase subunit C|nr:Asp-tRNA(Asn)/Glu-tRNA(Gln) amidotransferase subunit GatC [Phycisphaerales bacterium]
MNEKTPNESISSDAVRHVAKLSRLALSDDELERTKEDLASIFSHIDRLKQIDTDGVEPLDHPTELCDRSRDDSVGPTLSRQQVLENAPATKGDYIDVPKVLGGAG